MKPPAFDPFALEEMPSLVRFDRMSWDDYLSTIQYLDRKKKWFRSAYLGSFEIELTAIPENEFATATLRRMVEVLSLPPINARVQTFGRVTCQDSGRRLGMEPDCGFYTRTPPPMCEENEYLDVNKEPLPDFALEVGQVDDRYRMLAAGCLGFKELLVWHGGRKNRLRAMRLYDSAMYREVETLKCFKAFPVVLAEEHLRRAVKTGEQHRAVMDFAKAAGVRLPERSANKPPEEGD